MTTGKIGGKNIVLGVCGGIAAYKSIELLRLLVKAGASVQVLMTKSAGHFVTPLTFEVLSGQKVCSNLFDPHESAAVQHIQWARDAHAVVVAPATANMIGKLAHGLADDALSTFMLAVTKPTMICPSMNSDMYASEPVQANLARLKKYGFLILDPEAGELACGTTGPGRLPEPAYIFDRLDALLTPKDFIDRRVLVTAGPTRETIDPVRFISNPSSGKMGYAIARAAETRGARVTLITGPTGVTAPHNVNVVRVTSADEMAAAVTRAFETSDIVIKSAAVADYKPADAAAHKIKKTDAPECLTLVRTTDILQSLAPLRKDQVMVGFAAETQHLESFAREKLSAKGLDMIVANLIGAAGSGFGSDTNQVNLFFRDGTRESLGMMPKAELAHVILDRVAGLMTEK